jgi:hypothetical protein
MADDVNQVFSDLNKLSPDDYVKQLGFEGPEAVMAKKMIMDSQAQQQAQQKYAGLVDQQYNQLAGQTGMDPYTKASLMFQAAGALAAPTRSGGFGESLGALGSQLAGPLMQQAQAERSRQDKLQQLQLARAKMGAEMQSGPDMGKMLQLVKSQRDYEQDKSKLQNIELPDGTKMPVIFKEGQAYDITGKPIDASRMASPQQADTQDRAQMPEMTGIPAPPADYFSRISPKNREKVIIAERDRSAKLLDKVDTAAPPNGIQNDINTIKHFLDLNYEHQGSTGPIIGMTPSITDAAQQMDKIAIEQSRKMRQPGEGAMSDFDAKQFAKASLSTSNRYDTNRNIGAAMIGAKQNELDYKQFRRDYLEQNDTLAGAEDHWKKYLKANPIFADSKDPNVLNLNSNRKNYRDWFRQGTSQSPQKVIRGPDGTLITGE